MPLIEVEDDVLAALKQHGIGFSDAREAAEAQAAIRKIGASGKRGDFLRIYKEVFPDAVVPEIDAAKPVLDDVAAMRAQMQEFIDEQKKKEDDKQKAEREGAANQTVSQGRSWLRREKKLDDDGVTAIEKVMQDLGVPNYEVAFNHWRASQPPDPEPLPSSYAGRSLDWFKEDERPDAKLLLNDPMSYRRKETGRVLQEIRDGKLNAA